MSTKTFSEILEGFKTGITKIADIDETVTAGAKNVRKGPTTMKTMLIDNMKTSSAKNWVKLFDVVDATLVSGTSKPVVVIPYPAFTDQSDESHGLLTLSCPGGLPFRNGISVMSSNEDGDELTTGPSQLVDAYFTNED